MSATPALVPGEPRRLDNWVTRIVAGNKGPMTGPGTNTYFVGNGDLAVIDPGPLDERHIAAVLAHGAGHIRWILCTHTHFDHSPAAARIAAQTGAQVIGMPPPGDSRHDATFVPDRIVRDGEAIEFSDATLLAIHTPGHDSRHVCYRLAQNGMLFTGDHVMQGSTVVIAPPDGNMRQYFESLRRLLSVEIAVMAPGHGFPIGEPHREIHRLIEHRLWREARVLHSLKRRGPSNAEELLEAVYPDLPPVLRHAATQSLTAHLIKLREDGIVTHVDGRYATS